MTVSQQDLDSFYQIASERIRDVGVETPEELFDLWNLLHPSGEAQAEIDAAIVRGMKDIEAGRHRPAREVTEELRKKHGIDAE